MKIQFPEQQTDEICAVGCVKKPGLYEIVSRTGGFDKQRFSLCNALGQSVYDGAGKWQHRC